MKILYRKGDVVSAPERIILHGCNARGVMGSGVAKAIRERIPAAYEAYRTEYLVHGLPVGTIVEAVDAKAGIKVLNGITQESYGIDRRQVDYEAIYTVLETVNAWAQMDGWSAVAMPRIGAGLGGGNWRIIEAMIEETSTHYQPVVYDLEAA